MLAVGVRGSQKPESGHRVYLHLKVSAMTELDDDYTLDNAGQNDDEESRAQIILSMTTKNECKRAPLT